jgi:hypothetical protein
MTAADFRDNSAPYSEGTCPVCGKSLKSRPGGRPKRYCSATCRKAGQRRRENIKPGMCVTHSKFGIGWVAHVSGAQALIKFRDRGGNVYRDLHLADLAPYKGPKAPKKRVVAIAKTPAGSDATFDGSAPAEVPWYKHGRSWRRNYYPGALRRLIELMERAYGKET